jgi:hypothetical protein
MKLLLALYHGVFYLADRLTCLQEYSREFQAILIGFMSIPAYFLHPNKFINLSLIMLSKLPLYFDEIHLF